MDAAIVHLCDPSGYLQRNLSILESTPAAVSALAKHPQLVSLPALQLEARPWRVQQQCDSGACLQRNLHPEACQQLGQLGPLGTHGRWV